MNKAKRTMTQKRTENTEEHINNSQSRLLRHCNTPHRRIPSRCPGALYHHECTEEEDRRDKTRRMREWMEINEGSIQLRSWYCTGGIKGKEIYTRPGQNVEGLAERKWQTPIIFRGQMKKKINGAWKWGSFNYPRRRREQTSITLEKKILKS